LLRIMSVSTAPGASAFTRIPRAAYSAAIERVKEWSAALAAAYMATCGENRKAPAEITFTTAAHGLFERCGSASCTRNTGPLRFTANDFSNASGVKAPSGCVSALAALLTTMSRRPKRVTVASTSARTGASSPRCVGTPIASPPRDSSCAAVSAHASGLRLATATRAPAATSPSATARPMPRVPPVTIATRPERSNSRRTASASIGYSSVP
jgi:hypothetical protein